MSMHSSTCISAKNDTASITANTTITRASSVAPPGDKIRLTQFQKASHAKEMTQDGFTLVDQSQTYAAIAARKYIATDAHKVHPTAQKVPGDKKDTAAAKLAVAFKGVLTTAINNQQVISTNVTLPGQRMERWKAIREALDRMKQCSVTGNRENFTDNIPMKKSAEPVQIRTITMTPCIIRTHREIQTGKFAKPGAHIRPTILS
jgi:hypothetical protein